MENVSVLISAHISKYEVILGRDLMWKVEKLRYMMELTKKMGKVMSEGVEKIIEQEKTQNHDIDALGDEIFFDKFLIKVLLKHIEGKNFNESQDIEINEISIDDLKENITVLMKSIAANTFCWWLNSISKKNSFPLPSIVEILSTFSKAKIFTKIDCFSGFYQIHLDEES